MRRLRPLVSLLLAAAVTLGLVGCGAPSEKETATYSNEQIAQIQTRLQPVQQARERLPELEEAIEARRWSDVESLIHGPLGKLRRDMTYITRQLLPRDREQAEELADRVFDDLERIDAAAKSADRGSAVTNYGRAEQALEGFLDLVPQPDEAA